MGVGLLFAVAAYVLWGFLPLYFMQLAPAGPLEIVSWRIVLSLAFCLILLTITRGWASFFQLVRDRKIVLTMALASVLIVINWLVFIYAALNGHLIEAALGYFINPIVTVLLGVFVLREKLRPMQWVSVGISVIAVLVLALGYGEVPYIALALAFSFGLYGLVKKQVGGRVDAIGGLTLETAIVAPLAIIQLVVIAMTTGLVFGTQGAWHTTLLIGVGAITAIPLLFFAGAARRLPLTYIGLTQYLAPILQFIVGVFIIQEAMTTERWMGFALIWLALVVLTIDMFRGGRAPRRASLEPA